MKFIKHLSVSTHLCTILCLNMLLSDSYLLQFQSTIYQEVMAMFYQISILSSAPYGAGEKDEKVKGYR